MTDQEIVKLAKIVTGKEAKAYSEQFKKNYGPGTEGYKRGVAEMEKKDWGPFMKRARKRTPLVAGAGAVSGGAMGVLPALFMKSKKGRIASVLAGALLGGTGVGAVYHREAKALTPKKVAKTQYELQKMDPKFMAGFDKLHEKKADDEAMNSEEMIKIASEQPGTLLKTAISKQYFTKKLSQGVIGFAKKQGATIPGPASELQNVLSKFIAPSMVKGKRIIPKQGLAFMKSYKPSVRTQIKELAKAQKK